MGREEETIVIEMWECYMGGYGVEYVLPIPPLCYFSTPIHIHNHTTPVSVCLSGCLPPPPPSVLHLYRVPSLPQSTFAY